MFTSVNKSLQSIPEELQSFAKSGSAWFASSSSAYMTRDLFLQWTILFINWLSNYRLRLDPSIRNQKALLIMDGHHSRENPVAIMLLEANNINLLILPSHVTHILQMFDVCLASPMKSKFTTLFQKKVIENLTNNTYPTNIANIPDDFIGTNGAYLYSGDTQKRKSVSLEGHTLVLAPHEGLVDSRTWIKCRSKCLNNQSVAKPVKAKATWLAGKIKCAHCGYALTAKIYRCKTKSDNRYYLCNNKYNAGGCNFGSLDADIVDGIVFEEMQKKLAEFKILSPQKRE